MPQASRSLDRRHGFLAGILCILLLLCGTTLQVSHAHLPHENHADCSLCVSAHAVAEIVILPQAGLIEPPTPAERPVSQTPHAVARTLWTHPLWNRPPPAASSPIA